MMIEQRFLEHLRDKTSELIANAVVTIDGNEKVYPIQSTKFEDLLTIQKFAYVPNEDHQGTMTSAKLVNTYGETLIGTPTNISLQGYGIVLMFEIKLKVEAVSK
ncbi:hypothetical protein EDM56_04335 [Brevibacillus fluminis]|uniref:Uncharacterized protein n=1 Tax=Brevibacillus fluminis TaxID=511487 RepID=A0A3M8DYD0_9BACL|nr:hypothetical protein [Brevibacillus fluminis]RNB91987.1 hypothetical protein EDM56_04335 [Brevibacillus fluminis]